MRDEFRKRVFTPVVLPLGLLGSIAVFAWSLSRVFLALPALAATFVALLVAGYVLGVGALVSRARELTARSIGLGLALGLVGVLGAGAVANAVGPREFHAPEEEAEAEEAEAGGDEAGGDEGEGDGEEVEIPEDAVVFATTDNEFTEAPDSVPAGTVTVALVNEGNSVHNVHIEETDEQIVEADAGATELAEVEFEAGQTYTYFCDVPGHRQTMEGEFTVED